MDRLTILEMEYALVSARLNTIDAQLALIGKRVDDIGLVVTSHTGQLDRVNDTLDRMDRSLTEITRHLGLGGTS